MVSPQPINNFRQGFFTRQHSAVWKNKLHRLHANGFFHERKSTSDHLNLARKQFQNVIPFVPFDPVSGFSTDRAIFIVNKHRSFFVICSIHFLNTASRTLPKTQLNYVSLPLKKAF
jgi:hypothetical protein